MLKSPSRSIFILGALLATLPAAAVAQAQSAWPSWLPSEWEAGGIVVTAPKYEGSKNNTVMGVPVIFPAGTPGVDGTVQFKGIDDVRVRLIKFNGFEAGPVAGYRFGREEDDGRRLRGLGDIDGGLVLGGYAAYRIGNLAAFASYNHQATGDETGGLLRFGLEAVTRLQPRFIVTLTGGATWASNDYMRSFFGVTAAQSARSGLVAFAPDSGIKDVFIGLGAEVPLAERWTLRANARYTHLVGDAADSPVVERQGQISGGLGLTYRFSIR